jgi:DNA-binding transcriptional regulator YiaG
MNAQRVIEIRESLGWTRQRLAKELHVHISTVLRWENNKATPTTHFAHLLEEIAESGEPDTVYSSDQVRALRSNFPGKKGAKQLAERLGVHWRTIYHWEEGVARISRANKIKLEALIKEEQLVS